jgi:hypothetical protein
MQKLACFVGDLSLYTKEAARMKNRTCNSHRQDGKISRGDFISTVAVAANLTKEVNKL